MSIELFMGSFEEFPERDNYVKSGNYSALSCFPTLRMQFSNDKKLDEAIKSFRDKLSQGGYQGAYYFAFSSDEKGFYLKGYPFKKK